jgi:hypothetical protein
MSSKDQREEEWHPNNHYKISVRHGKELLKKMPRYITRPQPEQLSPNEAIKMVSSKVMRYPPNYDPYRYRYSEQEDEPGLLCGCISVKQFKEC